MRDVFEHPNEPDFHAGPEQELSYNYKAVENMKQLSLHANIVNTYGEFDVVEQNQPALPMKLEKEERPEEPEQKKRFKYVFDEVDML